MFEPKCDWWRKIKWEDKTVLLKGILSIKRKDYGRFVELALHVRWREDARPRWSLRLRLGGKRGIREGAPILMESLCGILYYHFCSIVGCYN